MAALSAGLADFTFEMHRRLAVGTNDLVWSPFGVAITLGMIRCGSAGDTDAGLAGVMRCSLEGDRFHRAFRSLRDEVAESLKRGGARMAVGKLVVGHSGMAPRPSFLKALSDIYGAAWRTANFASESDVGALNEWVRATTRGRVDRVFDTNPDLRMTVTGIFCMQADWSQGFDIENTKPRPFLREDESSILVPTMNGTSVGIRVASADGVDLASLPYGRGGLAMLVVVPRRGGGLRALEGSLGRQMWNEWMVALARAGRMDAHVYMPRFSIEQQLSLREPLSAMGA
ncbi:MAG: hypothetical protein KJ579_11960, partial [Verrucomicrobia bacterium]|nr:hypothetical protein [Verrucomicrobiota bacterium]